MKKTQLTKLRAQPAPGVDSAETLWSRRKAEAQRAAEKRFAKERLDALKALAKSGRGQCLCADIDASAPTGKGGHRLKVKPRARA